MVRIKNGLAVFVKGILFQDWKAMIATVLGAVFFYIIQIPTSILLALFMKDYESAEIFIMIISAIITLFFIDFIFEKIGGTDRKIKIK